MWYASLISSFLCKLCHFTQADASLVDDSGSMQEEDRISALRDTLNRVAEFTTILSRTGISIRFINQLENKGGRWDRLTKVETINHNMDTIKYKGGTELGKRLR